MWLALIRSKPDGLVSQILPADWLVRPSARTIRDYITSNSWHVSAFVFDDARHFFPSVKTNLTLTMIDKRATAAWAYYAVGNDLSIASSKKRPDLAKGLVPFATQPRRPTGFRAGRGLSPGAQSVFVLTEQQRKDHSISLASVLPCVTSLRGIPRDLRTLSDAAFQKHYVSAGRRCWLLRTNQAKPAGAVLRWLEQAPVGVRTNHTCRDRKPWYRFNPPPVPSIVYSSGFREPGPRFVVNEVGARAVGSVHAIFDASHPKALAARLRDIDYESHRFRHAGRLMKIEVSQMNAILDTLSLPAESTSR